MQLDTVFVAEVRKAKAVDRRSEENWKQIEHRSLCFFLGYDFMLAESTKNLKAMQGNFVERKRNVTVIAIKGI